MRFVMLANLQNNYNGRLGWDNLFIFLVWTVLLYLTWTLMLAEISLPVFLELRLITQVALLS